MAGNAKTIILLGPSGIGKGTQAINLVAHRVHRGEGIIFYRSTKRVAC
jgi:adenylate kinase family enzyme